mgnify:CR=1 FL=1
MPPARRQQRYAQVQQRDRALRQQAEADRQHHARPPRIPAGAVAPAQRQQAAERIGLHRRLTYLRSIYSHLPPVSAALDLSPPTPAFTKLTFHSG